MHHRHCSNKMHSVFLFVIVTVATLAIVKQSEAYICPLSDPDSNVDWWKTASFYQIYPRSFKDSDNDGIGDLQGIIDKIDHFPNSGVDAIWLSPIFESPQVDQGYDISNYTKVDPSYGTNEDLKKLIDAAHAREVKVILDFVPNHTSDQHQWFIDSIDGDEEFKDYYIWEDGKIGEDGKRVPPNNWISLFKNSSWTWNEKRQQYYLHQFAPAQPDLNYRNPKVVEAMKEIMRFWLDQGVDGFRVDAVPYIFEDADLRDEPLSNLPGYNSTDYEYLDHIYTKDLDETFDMIYQWRKLVDDYLAENGGDTRVLMTEAYTDINHTMLFYGTPDGSTLGAHFAFNFNFITDLNINSTAQDIIDAINKWSDALPDIYTPNWVLGNHDNHRVATRFGPGNVDGFNMLKAFLPGVVVTYNGEEIGQENGEVSYEEGQDPSARDPGTFEQLSRDFERTPYQWDDTVNAGFNTGAKPWLPVSDKYHEMNLKKQKESSSNSHYQLYQNMAALHSTFSNGYGKLKLKALDEFVLLLSLSNDSVGGAALVFNKGDEEAIVDVSEGISGNNAVYYTSVDSQRDNGATLDIYNTVLSPHEALFVFYTNGSKTEIYSAPNV